MKRSDKRRCTSFPDADINKYQKNVTKVLQRCFDPDPESSSVDNRNAAEAPTPQVKLKTAPPSVRSRVSGSRSRASRDSSVTSGTGSKKAGKPPNFALTANCLAKSVCKKVKKMKSNSFNEKLPSTANCNLLDPPKNISKEDRIEVNLNNISYNSKVRLTIKDLHCEETVNNDPCCESSCSVVTDTFIQQLKNEIKNNQVKCTQSCGVGGGSQATHFDYVERLQEEIVVNKANCLEANKRQVEALKREICRYRMNMAVNSHLDSNERQFEADLDNLDEKANVADLPENAEIDGTPREEKPVETLFTSQASGFHSSSTESDLSHNFKDKIEEANALIDRVKNALEDIKVVMKSKPVSQEKRGEEHHFLASTKKFSAEAENEKPQSLDGESTSYPLEEQSSLLDQSFDLLMVKLNTIEEASESDVFRSIDQNAEKVVENKILPGSRNCEGFICAAVTNRASSPIEIGEVEGAETLEAQVKSRVEKGKEEVEENKNTNRTCNKCGHSTRPDESIAKLLEKEDKSSTKSDLKEATQLTEVSKRSLGINCNLSIASKEEAVEVNKDDSRTKCQATYCNLSIKSDAEVSNSSKQITNAVEERNRSDAASMKSQGILCNLSVPSVGELVGAAEHGDVPLKISQGVSCNLFAKSDEEMLDAAEDEESETALVKKPITIDNSGKGPKDKNLSIQAMPPINIRQSLVMQQTLHLDIKPTSSVINVMIPNSNIGYREIRKSSNDDVSGPSSGPPSCKDSGNVDASLLEANSKASVPINVVQDDQRSVMTDTSFANRLAKTLKSVSVDRANLSDDRMLFFKSYQVVRQHPKHSVDGMRESSLPNISRVSSEVYKTYINPAGYATTVPSEKSSFVPFYGSVPAKAGVPIGPLGKSSVPATAPTKGDPLCKLSEEIAIAITVPTTDSASYSGSTEDSSSSSNSNKSRSPWDIGFYSSKTTQCDLRKQSSSFSSATVSYRQIVGQFSEIPEKDVPRQDFSSSSGTTGSSDSANTYTKQPEEQPVISADKATSPKVAAPKTKSEGVGSPIEKNSLPSKVDRVIQVSLSSSSDESVVGATEEPHPSTVNYFIETLTQTTVQDISSFQKSSQIAERREELKKISTGFNKNRKSQNAGEPASVREDLSKGEDDNLLNSSVFRTEVATPSCGSGENNNRSLEGVLFSSQPNNTFFSECNLDVTTSNSTAVDESMSEGEVKCKCSVSIGELHTCKQAKHVKQSVKYLKMHPGRLVRRELKNQSLTIARQKAFYDNWVAYYTERNANRPINDSSSTSTNNSFTK